MPFKNKLFQETPIHSLVIVRIAFGLVALWECYNMVSSDLLERYYITPKFHFTYYGFEWIQNLPKEWIGWFFCALVALAVLIVLGLFYRIAIILFTLGFTYAFLIERMTYLNHFYMIILLGILLSFMPAHRYFSLDSYFNPKIKSEKISFWPILLLRFQAEIILVFAGIVKINYEWLVRLMPLKSWLSGFKTIDPLHYLFIHDWSLTIITYAVITLHLVGAPLLLVRQTRIYVFAIYCCFHTLNHFIFHVGSFPWMTIALTTIFFDPDWPKKIFKFFDKTPEVNLFLETPLPQKRIIISLMAIWLIIQILVPLRHLLYPGNTAWTRDGHRFSWRMRLHAYNGTTSFFVTDPQSNQQQKVNLKDYLTFPQYSMMQCQPDMILQVAHLIHKVWTEEKGYKDVKVTTQSFCSLNGRNPAIFIDPNVDLAHIEMDLKRSDWIMPFDPKSN